MLQGVGYISATLQKLVIKKIKTNADMPIIELLSSAIVVMSDVFFIISLS